MDRKVIAFILAAILQLCCLFISSCDDREEAKYRIEVVDKYHNIGSNWHLIGGRASETEYHIIYNVTPLNEKAEERMALSPRKVDVNVSYIKYSENAIGRNYIVKDYIHFY